MTLHNTFFSSDLGNMMTGMTTCGDPQQYDGAWPSAANNQSRAKAQAGIDRISHGALAASIDPVQSRTSSTKEKSVKREPLPEMNVPAFEITLRRNKTPSDAPGTKKQVKRSSNNNIEQRQDPPGQHIDDESERTLREDGSCARDYLMNTYFDTKQPHGTPSSLSSQSGGRAPGRPAPMEAAPSMEYGHGCHQAKVESSVHGPPSTLDALFCFASDLKTNALNYGEAAGRGITMSRIQNALPTFRNRALHLRDAPSLLEDEESSPSGRKSTFSVAAKPKSPEESAINAMVPRGVPQSSDLGMDLLAMMMKQTNLNCEPEAHNMFTPPWAIMTGKQEQRKMAPRVTKTTTTQPVVTKPVITRPENKSQNDILSHDLENLNWRSMSGDLTVDSPTRHGPVPRPVQRNRSNASSATNKTTSSHNGSRLRQVCEKNSVLNNNGYSSESDESQDFIPGGILRRSKYVTKSRRKSRRTLCYVEKKSPKTSTTQHKAPIENIVVNDQKVINQKEKQEQSSCKPVPSQESGSSFDYPSENIFPAQQQQQYDHLLTSNRRADRIQHPKYARTVVKLKSKKSSAQTTTGKSTDQDDDFSINDVQSVDSFASNTMPRANRTSGSTEEDEKQKTRADASRGLTNALPRRADRMKLVQSVRKRRHVSTNYGGDE